MDSDGDSDVPLDQIHGSSNNSDETFETKMEVDADDEDENEEVEIEIEEEDSESDDGENDDEDNEQESIGGPQDAEDQVDRDEDSDDGEDDEDRDDEDYEDNQPLHAELCNDPAFGGHAESSGDAAYEDDPDDDSDDDVPLSASTGTFSRLNKRPFTAQPQSELKAEAKDEGPAAAAESDSDDDVPLAARIPRKTEPRKRRAPTKKTPVTKRRKTTTTTRKAAPKTTSNTSRKVKKQDDAPSKKFEKPGQRREVPSENDPARLFYQSMYREKRKRGKNSTIAETWMLRHGLLEDALAKKVWAKLTAK